MRLADFANKIFNGENPFRAKEFSEIGSIENFCKALERERCRADRSGIPFALISFEAKNGSLNGEYFDYLAKVICTRMRTTDKVGWIDPQHIGLLLYNTDQSGAWSFVSAFNKEISNKITPPDCRVYVYPNDNQNECKIDRDDRGNGPKDTSQSKEKNLKNPEKYMQPFIVNSNISKHHLSSILISNTAEPVQDMSYLFTRSFSMWKRIIDIFGSIAGLIIFSPIMLTVAIAIKLTSKGPVLYRQKRVGKGGKIFLFLKFRSMYHNCDPKIHIEHVKKLSNGEIGLSHTNQKGFSTYKLCDDERVTAIGKFLRQTSLDELPQFLNVLKGEMSLVGPRPYPVYQTEACELWQRPRLFTIPGITGLGQLYARYNKSFTDSYRLDLQYLKQGSLWLDIKIIFKTLLFVFYSRRAQ